MNQTFTYSVLKYIHSQFLGEELNLGIVLYFHNRNSLIFKYPKNIGRFNRIYKTFPGPVIKQYLRAFDEQAEWVSNKGLGEPLEEILAKHFLVKDASTLQFSQVQTVVQYSEDVQKIADDYFRLYFPEEFPEAKEGKLKHISDNQLAVSYKNLILARDSSAKRFLKPGLEIRNQHAHFKSDLSWQNGRLNAVKGVSFDLKEEGAITDKALLLSAKLNYLEAEVKELGVSFDLIVTNPKLGHLIGAYENALGLLEKIEVPKRIFTEDKLEDYAYLTLKELARD